MPAWVTDPYGYILSFALIAVLVIAQTMRWAGKRGDGVTLGGGLKARIVSGMQRNKVGRRWLRHPWLTGTGMLVAAIVFGAVFNTVGRR